MRHRRIAWLAALGAIFTMALAVASPAWAGNRGDGYGDGNAKPYASSAHRTTDGTRTGNGNGTDAGNGKGNGTDAGNGKGNGTDAGNGKGNGTDAGNGNGTDAGNGNGNGNGSASASTAASTSAALPTTGSAVTGLVVVGLGMVAAGTTLLVLRRRRSAVDFTA